MSSRRDGHHTNTFFTARRGAQPSRRPRNRHTRVHSVLVSLNHLPRDRRLRTTAQAGQARNVIGPPGRAGRIAMTFHRWRKRLEHPTMPGPSLASRSAKGDQLGELRLENSRLRAAPRRSDARKSSWKRRPGRAQLTTGSGNPPPTCAIECTVTAVQSGPVENMESGHNCRGTRLAACCASHIDYCWRACSDGSSHHVGSAVARAACRLAVVPELDAAGR